MEFLTFSGPIIIGFLLGYHAFGKKSTRAPSPRFIWTRAMSKELLELYLNRMPGPMIANYFGCSEREVIRQVARLILGVKRAASDKNAPRFGKKWSWRDDQVLFREYQLGASPLEIASTLGRDELGVVFRILSLIPPQIPRSIVKKYGLKIRFEKSAGQFREPMTEFVNVCSHCQDVIEYCKCQIPELQRPETP
jgi:hypothetical protein